MPADRPQLLLLPGLGADRRFLHRQQAAFPEALTPSWIDPEPRESLAHYAERYAAAVRKDIHGPLVVGGVSLGGMLALEMARHLDARSVVLIASCREPGAVNRLLWLSELGSRLLPGAILAWSHHAAPAFLGRGAPLPPEDRSLLVQMVRDLPVPFLRWGARAVLEWPGLADPGVRVHHIHGSSDWVIMPRRVTPDTVVPGGAHVLNLSHPREVNAYLMKCLDEAASSASSMPLMPLAADRPRPDPGTGTPRPHPRGASPHAPASARACAPSP